MALQKPLSKLKPKSPITRTWFALCNPGQRPSLAHARGGHGQAGTVLGGELDPTIELRIAEGLPPVCGGPVGVLGGALDGFVGGQGIGVDGLAVRGDPSGSDATADG